MIDAGKLSEDLDQEENEEKPKKISFAEKFEKKKQKRFEKVKSTNKGVDKNSSETEKVEGLKKQKEKSDQEITGDKTFSGNKIKNKDKAGFKKQKKQKFKKTDSRTGSDRSRIFVKSAKKTGSNVPQRTKTFDGKSNAFSGNKPNAFSGNKPNSLSSNKPNASSSNKHKQTSPNKHIKFDKSGDSVHKKAANHTLLGSKPSGGVANTTVSKVTPKHIYFD